MNDLISRQVAIDALWAECMKLSDEMERNLETRSFALRADNKARRNRVEEDIEIIKQLPHAQPAELDTLIKALEAEHKKLREMESKVGTNLAEVGAYCISRQALLDAIIASINQFGGRYTTDQLNMWGLFSQMITELPSAEPQIIRCKDCKYWKRSSCCEGYCGEIDMEGFDEDHYCGYAERKQDG